MNLRRLLGALIILTSLATSASSANERNRLIKKAELPGVQILSNSCPQIASILNLLDVAEADDISNDFIDEEKTSKQAIKSLAICSKNTTSLQQDNWMTYFLSVAKDRHANALNGILLQIPITPHFLSDTSELDREKKDDEQSSSMDFDYLCEHSVSIRKAIIARNIDPACGK